MGSTNPSKKLQHIYNSSLTRRFLPWAFYICLSLLLFRLYFYPYSLSRSSTTTTTTTTTSTSTTTTTTSHISSSLGEGISNDKVGQTPCDYTKGKWVKDYKGPLYNGTTCGTIIEGQNCMSHGRPDMGYLYWRWKPEQCKLSRFEPNVFLQLVQNKHLAFVGDSMARNQLESLLCMISTASKLTLVYRNAEDNKFRRWHFASHNVTVSIYWSPFLVKGVEKSNSGPDHNILFLDHVDERWANDLRSFDMVVLSIGHWFLHPAVYNEGDNVIGCHYCPGLNHTEIEFYDVLRKALKTTLKGIIERRGMNGDGIDVILTTFSPSHFEGDWDKFGACPKTEPYKEGEKSMEGMDAEMRQIEIEEVAFAKTNSNPSQNLRLEALDVTQLSLMRPDGHPGPYMYKNPFANGITERVQNDCVHWCLPGPIDTWNEILLDAMKRWNYHHQQE